VKAVTWNIAAMNKNPFEHWITNNDESYNYIMKGVSQHIENPGLLTCIYVNFLLVHVLYMILHCLKHPGSEPGMHSYTEHIVCML